jgi:hypothetical protein
MNLEDNTFKFNDAEQLLVPDLPAKESVEDAAYLHGLICLELEGAAADYEAENVWEKTEREEDTERAQAAARVFGIHRLLKEFETLAAPYFIDEWLAAADIGDIDLERLHQK